MGHFGLFCFVFQKQLFSRFYFHLATTFSHIQYTDQAKLIETEQSIRNYRQQFFLEELTEKVKNKTLRVVLLSTATRENNQQCGVVMKRRHCYHPGVDFL